MANLADRIRDAFKPHLEPDEQKAKRVGVVRSGEEVSAYNGVLALIDDYDRALAAFPSG